MPERRRLALRLALVAVVCVLLANYALHGDTRGLLDGARGALQCLSDGQRTGCVGAQKWPVLQYLPALPLLAAGLNVEQAGRLLCDLNLVAFGGLVALTVWTLRPRSPLVAWTAVLMLCTGPCFAYANASFGEMLSAFFTLALVASWLNGAGPPMIAVLGLLAALSKETSFPFLGLLGLLCALAARSNEPRLFPLLRKEQGRLAALAVGLALAIVLIAAVNLFRYGVPYNAQYLREASWGPRWLEQPPLLAAQWFAPNGGLVFFWPSFVAASVALGVSLWRRPFDDASRRAFRVLVGVAGLLVLLTVALSKWWAPFGWWAWGPRLLVPWLPAALLLVAHAAASRADALLKQLLASRGRSVVLTVALVVTGMPHLIASVMQHELNHRTFEAPGACVVPDREATRAAYYSCLEAEAWSRPSPLVTAYRMVLEQPRARNTAPLFLLTLLLACATLRRLATQEGTGAESPMGVTARGRETRRRGAAGY
jgi:hypothetical protein